MTQDAAFQAAKTAFTLYGGFFQNVAREIGTERALALHCELGPGAGRMLAGMIKERSGDAGPDVTVLGAVQAAYAAAFGCSCEIEETPEASRMTARSCAIYEGLRDSGLDHQTIEAICQGISRTEYAELQKAYPRLHASLHFRASAEEPCVEEWALAR